MIKKLQKLKEQSILKPNKEKILGFVGNVTELYNCLPAKSGNVIYRDFPLWSS